MNDNEIIDSPFQVGAPVDPEYFKGRTEIIKNIDRYMSNSRRGVVQHFYLTGKRGMGKTSLVNYLLDYYERNHNTIGVHVVNDGIHDMETLLTAIIETLLNENKNETWYKNLYEGLKNEVKSIGLLGNTIEFNPKPETIETLRTHFPAFLKELSDQSDKNFIIVIDDINGLSKTPEFANWYKSLADTLALKDYNKKTKVAFILTSYPENLTKLHNHNPSFTRIFHHEQVKELTEEEIKSFYVDIFTDNDITFDEEELDIMIYYCSGMPTVMQEIGDATFFWSLNNNKHINSEVVTNGILEAGRRIGIKYLQPVLDKRIRSEHYPRMFNKITNYLFEGHDSFTKKDLESLFSEDENKVFKDFLKRAKELKIIELAGSKRQGEYQFTNKLYPVYFLIMQLKENAQQTLD